MTTQPNATTKSISWASAYKKAQDVDASICKPSNPEYFKEGLDALHNCIKALCTNDGDPEYHLNDSRIAFIAEQAARLNMGDINTAALISEIVGTKKLGSGKTAIKRVFAKAQAKLSTKSGEDMGAEWKAKWLEMVETMNENHANVISGSKNFIVRFSQSPITNAQMVEYIPPRELDGLYQHDKYTVDYADGKPVNKTRIAAWMCHPEHRRYENGVYFLPVPHGHNFQPDNQRLNLWSGFAIAPAQGAWDKIDYHIREVLAAGDKRVYEYLLNWCAYTIQHPDRQAGAVPVFRGLKRTGKGIFANWLVKLWGNHGVMINNGKHLTGQFNGHLEQTCLLFLDEAIYAGDKKHESMLKSLITEPKLMVERKHHDAKPSDNRLKIVMATNEQWAVPTSWDDARFCVCDVSDMHKGDKQYFDDLKAQMDTQEAMQGFMQAMIERDITGWHSGNIPKTKGLQDQIRESLAPIWHWWQDVLEAGEFGSGDNVQQIDQHGKASDLYADYIAWSDRMKKGEYARLSVTAWGREFSAVYSKVRKTDGQYYALGGVEDALMAFERVKIGVDDTPVDIDDECGFTF